MGNDDIPSDGMTRRNYLAFGGTVVGGGVLAGCTTNGSSNSSSDKGDTSTETDDTPTDDTPTDAGDGTYSVTMAPVGEVEFEEVPQEIFTILTHHTDMALALGHGNNINAAFLEDGGRLYNKFLANLGVDSVDWSDLYSSWNPAKEKLYDLNSDVHLADPAYVAGVMKGWENDDIEEVRETIGPWFGNTYSGQHKEPPSSWQDRYEYYTLWQIFANVSKVFKREDRYRVLADVHSSVVSTIRSNLPPKSERPVVAKIIVPTTGLGNGVWAYSMNGPGFYRAHTRPLGVDDAFPDMQVGAKVDLEVLVEASPDVILIEYGMTEAYDWPTPKRQLENDPVARAIPAVKHGRVYPQGIRYGGPIMNLFQLEMGAKQVYPDQYGRWHYEGGPYPTFPESDQLFDRQTVANAITGQI